jgi:hypothetical protein
MILRQIAWMLHCQGTARASKCLPLTQDEQTNLREPHDRIVGNAPATGSMFLLQPGGEHPGPRHIARNALLITRVT